MAGHRLAEMHLLVVFNPAARAGRAPDRVQALTAAFAEYGVAVTVLETRHPGHATQLLCDFDPDSMDGVVAAGGDGTLHEVVNGLCALPADRRPPLGVVPVGWQ